MLKKYNHIVYLIFSVIIAKINSVYTVCNEKNCPGKKLNYSTNTQDNWIILDSFRSSSVTLLNKKT